MEEKTFIMVKPDGVQRGLIGKIITKFEARGLKLVAMNFMMASVDLIKETYSDEMSQPYFPLLMKIMTSGPVIPMIWEGANAVEIGRSTVSTLITENALPGTLRGDFCLHVGRNICHGADSHQEAEMDIALWFPSFK